MQQMILKCESDRRRISSKLILELFSMIAVFDTNLNAEAVVPHLMSTRTDPREEFSEPLFEPDFGS